MIHISYLCVNIRKSCISRVELYINVTCRYRRHEGYYNLFRVSVFATFLLPCRTEQNESTEPKLKTATAITGTTPMPFHENLKGPPSIWQECSLHCWMATRWMDGWMVRFGNIANMNQVNGSNQRLMEIRIMMYKIQYLKFNSYTSSVSSYKILLYNTDTTILSTNMPDYSDDDMIDYQGQENDQFDEDALNDEEYDDLYELLPKIQEFSKSFNNPELTELKLKELLWLNYFDLEKTKTEIQSGFKRISEKRMYLLSFFFYNS